MNTEIDMEQRERMSDHPEELEELEQEKEKIYQTQPTEGHDYMSTGLRRTYTRT